MKKKKICFIVSMPLTAKALLLSNIKALSSDFDVYLIANFENEAQKVISPFLTKVFHVKIQRKIKIFEDLKAVFHLTKILRKESFDAIHTVTPKAGLIGMLAGRIANIKVRTHIFTGQVWHTRTGLMKWLLMNLDRVLVAFTTDILVDGEAQRQFLIDKKVIRENNSKVLGKGSICGVDTHRFLPDINTREKYRQELNYKNEDLVFMFLGRINFDKGVLELAKAFARLQVQRPNVKLLFIGFDEEDIIPQVQSLVGETNFTFYGSTSEPELLMQAGDVLCLPSHREGFGCTVIEGSLLGLPIICSDTYGLRETIVDDVTGLRHLVSNVDSIYNQLQKIAENPQLGIQMGNAGQKYVLDNFTAEKISGKWLKYYQDTLN